MPLPLIPAAIALASLLGYGAKKGLDGLESMNEAEEIGKSAQALHQEWVGRLDESRSSLQSRLKVLDGQRKSVTATTFRRLFDFLEQLDQKARFAALERLGDLGVSREQVIQFAVQYVEAGGILSGGVKAALAGAGASAAATSLVTAFATAGTGTAISGLTGAAANSALLAWLGGGSLVAGGSGMAAGSLILGGIAIAPAALVAGFVIANEGEKAKTKAVQYASEIDVKVARIKAALKLLNRARERVNELQSITEQLDARTNQAIAALYSLRRFDSDNEKHLRAFAMAMQLAKAESELLRVPIFTPQGEVNEQLAELLNRQRQLLDGARS